MGKTVYAFWCRHPSRRNFGDALTPWLIKKITGRHPTFIRPEVSLEKYFVVGSIIGYAVEHCTVWGAGIISRADRISPRAKLLAVRGPLTQARAVECSAYCPEVCGDPALLLPRFYRPIPGTRGGIGVVPHYLDKPRFMASCQLARPLRLIDIQDPIESVIDQLVSCDFIVSSSLHAIIAANAYGVPAMWGKFNGSHFGDDSKFADYYLSVGQEPQAPVMLGDGPLDPDELRRHVRPLEMTIDLDRLWNACPFRCEA